MTTRTVLAVLPHFFASPSQLLDIVSAVMGQGGVPRCELVIVANDPSNDAHAAIAGIAGVEVFRPGLNMGYVGALEWARRRTGADYLWVLQDDLVPQPGCLVQLAEALDHGSENGGVAAVSPIEVDRDGSLLIAPRTAHFNVETGLHRPSTPEEIDMLFQPVSELIGPEYPFIAFAGTLANCNALERIGGFDVDLWPLALVDVNTSIELQRHGYAIQMVHEARIVHDRSEPTHFPRIHHWSTIAHQRNTRRVRARFASGALGTDPSTAEIPPEILYSLARSMSEFMFEYSEWVHKTSWRGTVWQVKYWSRRFRKMWQ